MEMIKKITWLKFSVLESKIKSSAKFKWVKLIRKKASTNCQETFFERILSTPLRASPSRASPSSLLLLILSRVSAPGKVILGRSFTAYLGMADQWLAENYFPQLTGGLQPSRLPRHSWHLHHLPLHLHQNQGQLYPEHGANGTPSPVHSVHHHDGPLARRCWELYLCRQVREPSGQMPSFWCCRNFQQHCHGLPQEQLLRCHDHGRRSRSSCQRIPPITVFSSREGAPPFLPPLAADRNGGGHYPPSLLMCS